MLYIVPALFIAVGVVGGRRGEWEMLKRGIPKVHMGMYQNQALNEEDPFRSTIREIEKGRNLGGSAGTFELTRINTSGSSNV